MYKIIVKCVLSYMQVWHLLNIVVAAFTYKMPYNYDDKVENDRTADEDGKNCHNLWKWNRACNNNYRNNAHGQPDQAEYSEFINFHFAVSQKYTTQCCY